MEVLWLTVGLLFGVCFSAVGLCCYQLKRISACEQAIRTLKNQAKPKETV